MLFALLKIPAKIGLWIYCRKIIINKKQFLQSNGPLLIAANHPNSFLDALILATIFKQPVYSLARGDAFANGFYNKLLRAIKILPVYRISEGAKNLEHNYTTFDACKEIFKRKGIVLIFCEGRCINEWHLRPLKKGTARLSISAWQDAIPLRVLPLGINYNSFDSFGKNVQLNFGNIINQHDIPLNDSYGKNIASFNTLLQDQLQQLVIQVNKDDRATIKEKFIVEIPLVKKIVLFLPAILGYCIHFPVYYPLKIIIQKSTLHNDHFDSIMAGALMLLYFFYLPGLALLLYYLLGGYWWTITISFPFFAWSYVQLKQQFQ